jgi:hypothetical protein
MLPVCKHILRKIYIATLQNTLYTSKGPVRSENVLYILYLYTFVRFILLMYPRRVYHNNFNRRYHTESRPVTDYACCKYTVCRIIKCHIVLVPHRLCIASRKAVSVQNAVKALLYNRVV